MGGGAVFFVVVGDGDEGFGADGGLLSRDGFHEFLALRDEVVVFEEVGEDDISHGESDGGGWWASHEFDEVVVASSTGDGSFAIGDGFEDGAGVVGETSGDVEVC